MTVPTDSPLVEERKTEEVEVEERVQTVPADSSAGVPDHPRLSGFLIAVGMLIVGVALGWLLFAPPATETDLVEDPVASGQEAPTADLAETGEPVADVAESLMPSVVQIETQGGLGSGVVYDSDGLILTAAHVVQGFDEVTVRMANGDRYNGEVLGGDAAADIAVVRVDATDLPAAPLAGEEARVGQLAVAIGSPYGFDSTVTSGVVSAVNQAVGSRNGFQSLIQTDAAINPGNSGGALANRDGEVIGINVSIFSTTGGNDGVGFAVPIEHAKELADSVVSGEPINNAVLGVLGTAAESGPAGALITEVDPGSAAAEAGIEMGDVVTSVDDVRVQDIQGLAAQIRSHRPGDTVIIELIRNSETIELSVTLGGVTD